MNQKTKVMLRKKGKTEPPDYSEEELKEIAEKISVVKDSSAIKLRTLIHNSSYMSFLLKDMLDVSDSEIYGYYHALYCSIDNIPLSMCDDYDPVEDIIIEWRLANSK